MQGHCFWVGAVKRKNISLGRKKARTVNVLREMRSPFVQIDQRLFVAAQMRGDQVIVQRHYSAAFAGPR